MINPNVIIIWPGTNASIPSGYTRETSLDGKYAKGTAVGVDPNTTGGNANHTHTSTSHTHTFDTHTHSVTTSSNNHSGPVGTGTGDNDGGGQDAHTHTGTTSAVTSVTVQNVAVTYASYSNDPPYYTVIYIKATSYQPIPDDAIVYYNGASAPTGFTTHAAADGRFYKGAAAAGNGGSTGGSSTNTHTITHTHTTSHTHTGTTGSPSNGDILNQTISGNPDMNSAYHQHTYTTGAATPTSDNNTSIGAQSETVLPYYCTMLPIQNTSGNNMYPVRNMVAMWLGTLATIPPGWVLCDGNNGTQNLCGKYIYNHLTVAGSVSGSNTHTHTAQSHYHNISSHTHSGGSVQPAVDMDDSDGSGANAWDYHYGTPHTIASVTSTAGYINYGNTTADSSNNEPEYRTVAYIQFKFMAAGAGIFGLL